MEKINKQIYAGDMDHAIMYFDGESVCIHDDNSGLNHDAAEIIRNSEKFYELKLGYEEWFDAVIKLCVLAPRHVYAFVHEGNKGYVCFNEDLN